jgi:hypothetical protein
MLYSAGEVIDFTSKPSLEALFMLKEPAGKKNPIFTR